MKASQIFLRVLLAVDVLSNGKFSSAVIKMLKYCHEIKQRYHDDK